jgi:DNA-binding MarR family transcriptional regulator
MYFISMGTPLEPTNGFLIWRLSMKWRAAMDRVLAPLGLTHAQFSVLGALGGLSRSGRRPSQRELADFTGLEPIYVSKLARALEKAGLVERPADPDDPRAVRLTLTGRGREVLTAAITAVHAKHTDLTSAIGGPDGERNRELRDTLLLLLAETPSTHHLESERTMTAPRTFNGQNINLAAAATRGVLDALVARAGLTFEQFVTLRTLVGAGPADRETVARTTAGPAADEAAIGRALDQLEAAGLIRTGENCLFEPAPQGKELFEQVSMASAQAGDQLFEGIDGRDLAVTERVLDLITRRAKTVRAEL